ncbi:beta-alanine-activating enzyme-like [Teleopsis dalmanni]|uniref:beta-alanine-activating enzyme-like n=1 Tax=Teleopsis dalmanni TaxID=139649 RepID=UPI0018CFE7CB|nr:beta-alanine-activating enzyme-like [Teleopsis dalmanni]
MAPWNLKKLHHFSKQRFILYRYATSLEKIYTYADVLKEVTAILDIFKELEIAPQSGIALLLQEHTPASCALLLSILNADCYFCPLELNTSVESLTANYQASGATYFIADNDTHEQLRLCLLKQLKCFDLILYISKKVSVDAIPRTLTEWDKICYIIGTTGSTGAPKMVHVPYSCIAPNLALSKHLQLSAKDIIFLCSPFTFDPFIVEYLLALDNGAAIIITTSKIRLSPQKLVNILFPNNCNMCGVTTLQLTPSLFRLFGVDAIRDIILSPNTSLRNLILGGEQFPSVAELQNWFSINKNQRIQTRLFNIYGITEVSCWSTIYACELNRLYEKQDIPIGQPIENETLLRIVNNNDEELFGIEEGELQVGSKSRKCYIPQLDQVTSETQLNLTSNELLFRSTGDLVRRDENGDIYYLGRLNNTIKRFGKRLSLDVLSHKIDAILRPTCVQSKCIWNAKYTKLICCLNKQKRFNESQKRICRSLLLKELHSYEKPDTIVFMRKMPLNKHGKLNQTELLKSVVSRVTESTSGSHMSIQSTKTRFSSVDLLGSQQQQKSILTLKVDARKKQPIDIFKHFLVETLGLQLTVTKKIVTNCLENPKGTDLSFLAAGGSSFNALSLVNEIGMLLPTSAVQSNFLNMLLNENIAIAELLTFLKQYENMSSESKHTKVTLDTQSYLMGKRKLLLNWRADLKKCVDATPTVAMNRYICIGSHAHIMVTLDAYSGQEIARVTLPDRIECATEFIVHQADDEHLAVVGCYDGFLYVYDYLLGKICWSMNIGGLIKAKPLLFKNVAIVGSYSVEYNLACICLKTRSYIWRLRLGTKGIFSTPILANDCEIFACSLDGTYAKIHLKTGEIVWSNKCNTPIFSTPALICRNTKLVVAEVGGKVLLCEAENGAHLCALKIRLHYCEIKIPEIHRQKRAFRKQHSNGTTLFSSDDVLSVIIQANDSKVPGPEGISMLMLINIGTPPSVPTSQQSSGVSSP